ncbi:MAG: HAD family hydrolase [Chloroflexota bacterium]|nr:HAD family hydrolase [Chloroflexota bacterium]
MAVEALLIDVDGTLIDSNPLHTLAWLRAFRRLGHEVEANRVLHLIGMGGDQLAPTILGEEAGDEAERAKELWIEEYSRRGLVDHVEPLPGAVDLLRALKERGIRVALASSGEKQDIDRYVELLGGREMFTELVTSSDVAQTKPAPDIFAVALDRLGRPAGAAVIGDTVFDVEAAGKLGLPCVGVLTGGIERQLLIEAGATAVYTDTADVLAHLDAVLGG